ncbi:lipase family protein [Sphingobium ummariense]
MTLLLAGWWLARPPRPDAFYDPPAYVRAAPGTLLRSEAFTRGVPAEARAWRILYATTRTNGSPAVASAIVMTSARPSPGRHPVIAWAHGTTGVAAGCAPSLLADPFANVPALEQLVDHDWVYVASDYAGMGTTGGHAYLVGDDAARGVLDAVRAARQLRGLALDGRTVVWGHSQGGASALWAGIRARAYAPDVPLAGVAAIAPASDLPALLKRNGGSTFGKMVSAYMIRAYAATYPDIDEAAYVSPALRPLVGDIAGRCISLFSGIEAAALSRGSIFSRSPADGPLGRRLRENVPDGPIPVPLLIAQGLADKVVLPDIQRAYVARRCAAGQRIDYRTYDGRDHLTVLASESPFVGDLVAWTADRLAGHPASGICPGRGQ